MNTQQLVQDFEDFLVKVLPEVIKEVTEEGFLSEGIAPEKLEEAVKEAILFHGRMQLFNIKEGVDDEEMDKTVAHILSNQGEFKRYLKNKVAFA